MECHSTDPFERVHDGLGIPVAKRNKVSWISNGSFNSSERDYGFNTYSLGIANMVPLERFTGKSCNDCSIHNFFQPFQKEGRCGYIVEEIFDCALFHLRCDDAWPVCLGYS